MRTVCTRVLALVVCGGVFAAAPAAIGAARDSRPSPAAPSATDALAQSAAEKPYVEPDSVRTSVPATRYDPAGGCYIARSTANGKYLTRVDNTFAATAAKASAEPLRFKAYDLGKYLLFTSNGQFFAAQLDDGITATHQSAEAGRGYLRGTSGEEIDTVRDPVVNGSKRAEAGASAAADPARSAVLAGRGVVAAKKPAGRTEWVLRKTGNGFSFELPVDDGDPATPGPLEPPISGTLIADSSGALGVVSGRVTSTAAQFGLERSTGCAQYPEIGTQVSGPIVGGASAYAETQGYFDGHMHGMAFEFLGGRGHCGRPWHPYGVTFALVDCPDHGPGGYGAIMEQALTGSPGGHNTDGWPKFTYWPDNGSYTHEQTYYTWLQRAWRSGLRMYTNLLVENSVLCEVYPLKKNSCNEMDAVRLQAQRLRELVRYVDAQSGGPGEGWLRIVTDPYQARRIINAGKLAVIMGIEVSTPFDCGEYLGRARCTAADIDRSLNEVYALGVRQMELTNKFDNALTGVKGDSGLQGPIVNAGNRYETGHYWKMQTCSDQAIASNQTDHTQPNVMDDTPAGEHVHRDSIFAAVIQLFGKTGTSPVYPQGPHCNAIGLSDLGQYAIEGLIKRGMIFDPDHMSATARAASLDYVESRGYSGVISSHSWADDVIYRRILALGGVVTPHGDSSVGFVEDWQKLRNWADPRFTFGLGFGSDINGFSATAGPRNPGEANDVDYPFKGLGGVTVNKQKSGEKTYDINTDGVEHYGMFADWIEDGRQVAGPLAKQFMTDVTRGAETYLQMWERAIGIRGDSCRADIADLTTAQLNKVKVGMAVEQVLALLGQPNKRQGQTFAYCATAGSATVHFDSAGTVT